MRRIAVILLCACPALLLACAITRYPNYPNRSAIVPSPPEPRPAHEGRALVGFVHDEQGVPLGGAFVCAVSKTGQSRAGAVTDAEGRFSIDLSEDGSPLRIEVLGEERHRARLRGFTCPPGAVCFLDITLSPCGPGCKEGLSLAFDDSGLIDSRSCASGAIVTTDKDGEPQVRHFF